jgi:ethylene receptor
LESFGFAVEVTGSSYGALELLKSEPFDFVMLSLSMPDMSGFDLLSSLKAEIKDTDHQWPVILGLARSVSVELHGQCLEAGMNGVLGKPLISGRLKKFFTESFVL